MTNVLYMCDFAKKVSATFSLEHGITRVQASVAEKYTRGLWRLARCQQRAQAQT